MSIKSEEYVDLYEVLEVSPNATMATIERVFRYLVKRYHPDTSKTADMHKFTQLVDAFETLRDPARRAAFDAEFEANKHQQRELVSDASMAGDDVAERHQLLTLFYAKRRRNMRDPGIGVSTLESLVNYPVEVLDFHIWYFREKGLIDREESGLLSITATGVDRIEATLESQKANSYPRLTQQRDRLDCDLNPASSSRRSNGRGRHESMPV